ncbi:MAG: membrane dipeptidase [Polyangiaceae bacterium]
MTLSLPPLPAIPVVDLHVDTPWKVHFKGRSLDLVEGHATPKTLGAGGYRGIVYPIYLADYLNDGHPRIADADAVLATIRKLVARHDILAWAPGQPGYTGPLSPGTIGVFVAIEGAGAFADDITQIDRFIAAGVRLVGPVHAANNALATSATGKPSPNRHAKPAGLTPLGRTFCERVYAAGALIDVSHMSTAAFDDLEPIAKKYRAPIVATHSNAHALAKHPRNLSDRQLRVIAATGGVAGLNVYRPFVSRGKKVSLRDVVAQVRHMVKVAGVEHVAIGSDYDGGTPVRALRDASRWPRLVAALRDKGFSDADLRKIFAENALRVLAWKPAASRP